MQDAEQDAAGAGRHGAELDRRGREAGRQHAHRHGASTLTGSAIDHFAEINLAGFVELTEALGGVPVCLNKPVRDTYSGVDLPAGLADGERRRWRSRSSASGTASTAATSTGSPASRRSPPGLAQRVQGEGTLTDPARSRSWSAW